MTNFKTTKFCAFDCIYIFYIISLFSLLTRLKSYTYHDYNSVSATQVYLFSWIPSNTDLNATLSFVCPVLMTLLFALLFLIKYQWARVVWALLFFIIEAFSFSYVLGHERHMYVWINLYFALLAGTLDRSRSEETYLPYIRAAQLQLFVIYGVAGLWKLKACIESLSNSNIVAGFDYVPYAIAWELLNSNRAYEASLWIMNQPAICLLLATLVILAQSGSIVIAFFPRFYFSWGLILSLFHIGTLLTVNVFFLWSIPPILIFLCFYDNKDERIFSLFFKNPRKYTHR
jgi:hypothetical protein